MSIHWPIIRSLLRSPRRVVAIDDNRAYRAAEMLVAALHVSTEIRARCESPTVGILLPTSGLFPIAALAGWIAGKTVVPLNFLLSPDELAFVLADCGTDTVISAGPMLDYMGDTAQRCLGPAGPVRTIIRLDELSYRQVPDIHWPALASDHARALILYTSGTSGRPKGVMLSHANISANISQVRRAAHFTPRDTLLGVLPQFHSFGLTVLTLLPLTVGCGVVYSARFVPAKVIRLIRQHRPTAFVAIPSMYNALLHLKDAGPDDFAATRFLISGGEPLPAAISDAFWQRFHVRICEGYGLTETAPVASICLPHEYRPGSVGRPLPGVKIRIADPDSGADLPPGREGEVRIAGPNVMLGYFNRPHDTAAAFDDRHALRTGDIGRFDHDGHLYITGRIKEMLIIGGENVFPREIEDALNNHPHVLDSGVIGVRDPVRGEVPAAFVQMRDNPDSPGSRFPFNETELKSWARQRLAGYKVPRDILEVESLPRSPTGKVLRRKLLAEVTKSESHEVTAPKPVTP